MTRVKPRIWFAAAGFCLAGAALLSLSVGRAGIKPGRIAALLLDWLFGRRDQSADVAIVLQLRLPRIVMGGLIGAGLAAAGTSFQAILRNPLADPYVIGVSAGAGLGAALGIMLGLGVSLPGFSTIPLLAFLGAALTVTLVYLLARVGGRVTMASLLLSGVAVGAFLTACISLLLVFFNRNRNEVIFWLMGGLTESNWQQVLSITPFMTLGLIALRLLAHDLNLMSLGEDQAAYLGLEVTRVRNLVLAIGSLLAGAAVASSGVIGFVGLMVPHMARMLIGGDHRRLVPFAALFGAVFLIAMDTLARTLLATEVPVGVITALCGGPFFLWLLRRKGRVR